MRGESCAVSIAGPRLSLRLPFRPCRQTVRSSATLQPSSASQRAGPCTRRKLACWRARIYRITAEPALTKIVRSSWSDTRLDLDGVAGALGGGSDERPDAEVLHVPLREPAVV